MRWPNLVLEAKSLACERGGRLIFKDLNFTVASGEVLELRGPNGSGKSSLLRLVAGFNLPSSGEVSFNGQGSRSENAHYIGHSESVKPGLTVYENAKFWQKFLGPSEPPLLSAFRLERLAGDEARLLSEGQRRRLALLRLVAVARPLWLLDEPTVGLDLQAVADLHREMKEHLESGGLIIAATHVGLGVRATCTVQMSGRV